MQENKKTRKQLALFFYFLVFLIFCFFVSLTFQPSMASADYYFNPHFILTDEEMTDYNSLSLLNIQRFLEEKDSGLASRSLPDYQGEVKPVSTIIWQAAQESQINPRVLLTTLQKEQSLISDPTPTQQRLDRAMGYRCPDFGICNPSTLDFGKQVDGAAWQLRQYLNNPSAWTYQMGQTYEIDGYFISPVNQATANLYNYTPHHSGNKRFWEIWQDYWGRNYPDGSLVKTANNSAVWLIQFETRRLITSWSVFLSRFNPRKILTITQTDLEKYEIGPPIKFANYSLLQAPDKTVYLVVDDEIRPIASPEVFRTIGFNWEEVEEVDEVDLSNYQIGADITVESIYPTGALLQDNQTGGVYYVKDGLKKPIYSREILKVNFPNKVLTSVSPEELDKYLIDQPVKFKDGELIKATDSPQVYVISDGKRRWIKTEEVFAKFGYKWDNLVVTTPQAVNIHPLGEDIE